MARISTSVFIVDRRRLRLFLNKYLEEYPFEEYNDISSDKLDEVLSSLLLSQAAIILEDIIQ